MDANRSDPDLPLTGLEVYKFPPMVFYRRKNVNDL